METYILVGLSFAAWLVTVVVVRLLMRESEHAFVVGALVGLLMAGAAAGAYWTHLSACRTCI